SVFGQDPLFFHFPGTGNRTIVAGALERVRLAELPADCRRVGAEEIAAKLEAHPYAAMPATDDWPHLYIRERRVPREYLGVLAGGLAGQYFWPGGRWAPGLGRLATPAAVLYLGLPMGLAAVIFASTFRQTRCGSAALASNLLGAVLGGVTEYLSLAYGIRALS